MLNLAARFPRCLNNCFPLWVCVLSRGCCPHIFKVINQHVRQSSLDTIKEEETRAAICGPPFSTCFFVAVSAGVNNNI